MSLRIEQRDRHISGWVIALRLSGENESSFKSETLKRTSEKCCTGPFERWHITSSAAFTQRNLWVLATSVCRFPKQKLQCWLRCQRGKRKEGNPRSGFNTSKVNAAPPFQTRLSQPWVRRSTYVLDTHGATGLLKKTFPDCLSATKHPEELISNPLHTKVSKSNAIRNGTSMFTAVLLNFVRVIKLRKQKVEAKKIRRGEQPDGKIRSETPERLSNLPTKQQTF